MNVQRRGRCGTQSGMSFLLLTAAFLVATCAREEPRSPRPPRPSSVASGTVERRAAAWPQLEDIPLAVKHVVFPTTERGCREAGGLWAQRGLGKVFRCDFETEDSRKICTDSLQCEGECLVAKDTPIASRAIGSCSDVVAIYGCHSFVEGGLVRSVCSD